jgi:tetratricopeptide (TPR) repeat protein
MVANTLPRYGRPARILMLTGLLVLLGWTDALAQRWQWPEKAENLKVLPEDTGPDELRATMFSFVQALGVRCEHCHDDSQGNRLAQIDFPADTKETKKIARIMLQMVRRVNGEELSALDEFRPDRVQVTCITCHRGATKPQLLEDVLAGVIAEAGVEAAIARYHELRERYEDGFTYNFRESTLNTLGYRLLRAGQVDDAIALFKLNVEIYPDAWNPYDSLAEAYMTKGQNEQAIALYRQSLVLNPDNRNAVEKLQQLKGNASNE